MEWYKTRTSLRKNPIYKRLSPLARQAFRNAMDAVADYEQGDKLALRVGPLTPKELAEDLLVPVKSLPKVLQELQSCGFLTVDSGGVFHIARFTEKTESNAERQRRYRQNKHKRDAERYAERYGNSNVTGDASRRDSHGVTSQGDGSRAREEELRANKSPNGDGDGSPRQAALGVDKPADIAAYRILDAAWPVVSTTHDVAMSQKRWRQSNKAAALDLAGLGKTPDDVVAMLRLAYEHAEGRRFYGGIVMLAKLAEHWPKLAALDAEPERDEAEIRKAMMRGDYLPIC